MTTNNNTQTKIERCGQCGVWLLNDEIIPVEDFPLYGIDDLEKSGEYELTYCGDCLNENSQPRGYVTRDMAMDAQDLSLEGQPLY